MAKIPKFLRVSGWKRNPKDTGPNDDEPKFLRWFGWRKNPEWSEPKEPKYLRVKGWKKNPDDRGPHDSEPPFIRWFGWRKNPKWVAPEPTLANIKVDLYIENLVPVAKVPKQHRKAYRDTVARFALALHRSGYGPGGTKGKKRVNSSYRFYEHQRALYQQNMISPGKPKPGHALTAVPGTSPHERGLALDVNDVRHEKPLIDECRKLGLKDDVPSEKWHLTNHAYRP